MMEKPFLIAGTMHSSEEETLGQVLTIAGYRSTISRLAKSNDTPCPVHRMPTAATRRRRSADCLC
jgi:hypothetical protein